MKASPLFKPVALNGANRSIAGMQPEQYEPLYGGQGAVPTGEIIFRGIPFNFSGEFTVAQAKENAVSLSAGAFKARWLVFAHRALSEWKDDGKDKLGRDNIGKAQNHDKVCEYKIKYADGGSVSQPIRALMETSGENSFLSVSSVANIAIPTATESNRMGALPKSDWGNSQTRTGRLRNGFNLSLYAWENPRPEAEITGIDVNCLDGDFYLLGVSAGDTATNPLRYGRRRKTALKLAGEGNPLGFIDTDLGSIISVLPRPVYDNAGWEKSEWNSVPENSDEYLVEYTSHEDAVLYPVDGQPVAVKDLCKAEILKVSEAEQKVTVRVLGPDGRPTPVRIHAHGIAGEYLPPRDRHRVPNPYWFEDYSPDYLHNGKHLCAYITGVAEYLLPRGEVFFEVSKGYEIMPQRVRFDVKPETDEIVIKLQKVLDWREKGWVTADTHVHFLSPHTALLEGEAEGVNVVNLLASQWGELFTNVGDFTGSELVSANKEYMVSVGTENRQHVMGHISLLAYDAPIILPLTTDGPGEAALGDPMDITLSDWARRCREQSGVVVMPHFPFPRGEADAVIVSNLVDGVESTSWGSQYAGISPGFLAYWYRFLNCGYHIAVVGGTDKMSATTAIGTARTYAKIDGLFSMNAWKDAVRAGRTFVSFGALADIEVEGAGPGGKISTKTGGTVTINWKVASAAVPVTAVELVVNGETADGTNYDGFLGTKEGSFRVAIPKSSWVAIRVRGHITDKPEIIIAHTSSVMVIADGQPVFNTPDAVAILEQIEGVTAYVKNIGTRAQEVDYKRALLTLSNAYNALHNRLHIEGQMHAHSVADMHDAHKEK